MDEQLLKKVIKEAPKNAWKQHADHVSVILNDMEIAIHPVNGSVNAFQGRPRYRLVEEWPASSLLL